MRGTSCQISLQALFGSLQFPERQVPWTVHDGPWAISQDTKLSQVHYSFAPQQIKEVHLLNGLITQTSAVAAFLMFSYFGKIFKRVQTLAVQSQWTPSLKRLLFSFTHVGHSLCKAVRCMTARAVISMMSTNDCLLTNSGFIQ